MSQAPRLTVPRLFEMAALLLLLAGLAQLIRTFLAIGYLPAPFVFDVGDTFMDWFNTAYWAHNDGAYTVWRTIYLPLSFVITGLFGNPRCYGNAPYDARDCDVFGIVFILLTYVACIVVTWVALRRRDPTTALMRTVAIAVGGPMLYALERGNLVMLAYIAFVLLYGQMLKSKAGVALASAFLVNMKVYLLFLILAFAVKREWRTLELAGLASLGLYLASMFIVGAGTPFELAQNLDHWFNYRATSIWEEVLYSTTYRPFLLFDKLHYPVRDFIEAEWVDVVKLFIQLEVPISRAVAILCIAGAWFYPKAVSLHRLVYFILMQSFIGQNPGGYAIILIVFPVFLERWRNFGTGLAILCCYLVSIPSDINITTILEVSAYSWLSERTVSAAYVLPLGAIIRPGLLLVMLWALAIDTLVDLHRAAKAGPPSLRLRLGDPACPRPSPR